jgi:hydroxymethylbilane synthase
MVASALQAVRRVVTLTQSESRGLRLGTRGSALARWQTDYVADLLRTAWPAVAWDVEVFHTQGDRVLDTPLPLLGGKGVFTAELEAALHGGGIDLAVHSLKDLPTDLPAGLVLGAVPPRAGAADVLVSRGGHTLETLPFGATVGTSSSRRAAQILHARPDLYILDVRGNVDTRVRKALAADGPYDAVLLAQAGLERLGHADVISQVLPLEVMLPAPAQGALGIQCRDDVAMLALLAPVEHVATRQAVEAERAFLAGVGGGCAVPVAAYATVADGLLHLRGRVTAPDGSRQIDVSAGGPASAPLDLGAHLAEVALAAGAAELLGDREHGSL